MYKPSSNYTLGQVDNNRSEYIDITAPLNATRTAYTAVSNSGKGSSAARRVLHGVDIVQPGSTVPLSMRHTSVIPSGLTVPLTDAEIAEAFRLHLVSLLGIGEVGGDGIAAFHLATVQAKFVASIKGVLTLDDPA